MIWSKYNSLFQEGTHFFLYNSASNSFAELDEDTYYSINNLTPGQKVDLPESSIIQQLIDIKAIVNDDRDTFLKLKYISSWKNFSNQQLMLTINPTLDCNFACPYCFENNHAHIYMTDEVEKDLIAFIKDYKNINKINVAWFGGEPLLAFNRIVSLTDKILKLNLDYEAGIVTNGYLLTDNVIKKLDELRIKSIQITIDGLADVHDSRRCLKNGKPTFEKIINNIRRVRVLCPQIRLSVRINIDKTNEENLIQLYKFFSTEEFSGVLLSPAFVDNINNSNKCVMNSAEQYDYIMNLFQKYGLIFSNFYPTHRRGCSVRNPNSIVIGPKGELYKCWNDVGNKDMIYGYLDGRITNESLLLKYLVASDPFDDKECKDCALLPICDGGCPYQRIKRDYEDKTIEVCPLVKKNLKSFLYNHYKIKQKNNL